jgi:hypothetical protein
MLLAAVEDVPVDFLIGDLTVAWVGLFCLLYGSFLALAFVLRLLGKWSAV